MGEARIEFFGLSYGRLVIFAKLFSFGIEEKYDFIPNYRYGSKRPTFSKRWGEAEIEICRVSEVSSAHLMVTLIN